MKKYIMLLDAVRLMSLLIAGKRIEGVLYMDEVTDKLTFKPYYRAAKRRRRDDRLVRNLEHGWVKESVERIKMFTSIPKCIGTARIMNVLDRETGEAKEALIDRELIELI